MTSPEAAGARSRRYLRRIMGVVLSLGLCLLLADGLAVAAKRGRNATGDLTKDPANLVKRYYDLDMKGARLEALSREVLKPYTSWKGEEPPWGYVVVIQGFTVVDDSKRWEIQSQLDVVIPVQFQVVGRMYWNTATFIPEPRVEEVWVRVAAVNDRWRILEPQVPPHVGRQRLVNYVRQAWLDTTDQAERGALAALQDDLNNAR